MSFISGTSLFQPQQSFPPSNPFETLPVNLMEDFIAHAGDPSLPCSTYHLIKYAFEKYSDKIIDYTLLKLGFDSSTIEQNSALEFNTSCVITGYVLTMILLGEQISLKFNRRINMTHEMQHAIPLGGINHFLFYLTNLFNGTVIKQINDDADFDSLNEDEQLNRTETIFRRANRNFIDTIHPKIEAIKNDSKNTTTASKVDSLKELLLNTDYNASVFESLKQEFVKNENQISEKESFIYAICMKEGEMTDESASQHFITIEQFLFNGEIRYRLYQSCIDLITLLESFKLQNYGENAEGTWNKERLNVFLDDFRNCYVPNISDKERNERIKQCFGFTFAHIPLCSLDKTRFSGLTLRYYAQKFDKEKVYKNLAEIISSPEHL
jgi:hypothetical protein